MATVDENGKVLAKSKGTTYILVSTKDGSIVDMCYVNVIKPVVSVSINKKSLTLELYRSEYLQALINPVDASNGEVTWSSSDEDVVQVSDYGYVTAVSTGSAVITVKTRDGEKMDTCEVEVLPKKATYVGGIIRENTVWSKANSPYILEDNIQIANGAILEIEPGVEIRGYGKELILYGELISIGSENEEIEFDDLKLIGKNTSYNPFKINLDYIKMNRGYLLPSTGDSQNGIINIKNSEFYNLERYIYIYGIQKEKYI